LTSGGVALTYAVVGNVLTAEAGAGNTVFTFSLNTTVLGVQSGGPARPSDAGRLAGRQHRERSDDPVGLADQATDFDGDTVTPMPRLVYGQRRHADRTGPISSGTVDEDGF
jgi:hypothetical protein